MKQGKFIVIDGSDGSGKKTQSDLLIKKFQQQGMKTAYYDFPQYESFFGSMVGRYLNGEFGDVDDVSPYLGSVLYAGDRYQASEQMKADLAAGKNIICNRYIQSNMAFQTAKLKDQKEKERFLAWIEEMEYNIFGIPKADLVLYLYVPSTISQILVGKKAERNYTKMKYDIHERNSEYLKRVETEYINLAKVYPEWKLINCTENGKILSIEAIEEMVWGVVSKELAL